MGTTLQNGVYLPNEGERNCYAGLKTNWEILDQKVADITALQQAVAGALHREIVESLPTTDIDPNTIYMILSGTSATENVYNEFMYVNNAWELIGTSATDLTNYYTKSEVDGKLLLKASASDLTSHTGDTTIHVTTADKNKWNNQTYVFRYSSTALTASSTNSNTLLDNTDNLKVGDKVIDSSGVLFSVTAIDTANSTFTIGTALIDLAQDSDVVHKSGDETVSGSKTFSDTIVLQGTTTPTVKTISNTVQDSSTNNEVISRVVRDKTDEHDVFSESVEKYSSKNVACRLIVTGIDNNTTITAGVRLLVNPTQGTRYFLGQSNNTMNLGSAETKWKTVYAYNYYYGSNAVEFSDKFVTTDTNQTISGNKTFSSNVNVYNSDSATDTANIILKNSKAERGSTTNIGEQAIYFLDKDNAQIGRIKCEVDANGVSVLTLDCTNSSDSSSGIRLRRTSTGTFLQPVYNNGCNLGTTGNRWYDVQTRAVNNLTPSSLSLPDIDNKIDISSYITDLTGVNNEYTPTVNGWICVRSGNATKISILDSATNIGNASISNTATYLTVMTPVVANKKVYINVVCTSLSHAYFIPCLGNV